MHELTWLFVGIHTRFASFKLRPLRHRGVQTDFCAAY